MTHSFKGDSDVLKTRGHARAMRNTLISAGHTAHVEDSNGEYRVWVEHPTHGDTIAYAHPDSFKSGEFTPYWVAR